MKTMAILGDSYSTYEGYIPQSYEYWYGHENVLANDVSKVEETWWHQLCHKLDYELVINCSYSGSAVCYTGYPEMDGEKTSFITRMHDEFSKLIKSSKVPDCIIIFGGTNDFWANSPIGEICYGFKTKEQLFSFAPAFCYIVEYMKKYFEKSRIIVVVNDEITSDICKIQKKVCQDLGVSLVELNNIEKQNDHPNKLGMSQIADQVGKIMESLI